MNSDISGGGIEGLTHGRLGNKWKFGLWGISRCGKDPAVFWKWQKLPPPAIPCWGVGVEGGNLVINILLTAAGRAGIALGFPGENPKDIPAHSFNESFNLFIAMG